MSIDLAECRELLRRQHSLMAYIASSLIVSVPREDPMIT